MLALLVPMTIALFGDVLHADGGAREGTLPARRVADVKPARGFVERIVLARHAKSARVVKQASLVSQGGMFRVHYDTTGSDSVAAVDLNGTGIPDWPELTANIADSVINAFRLMGYDAELGDGGAGGGAEYDIYVRNLASQSIYGRAFSGSDGYLELDNDYAEEIYSGLPLFDSRGLNGLKVTVAHELFHSVQFRYLGSSQAQAWWMEMSATFMEEVIFDEVNDYHQYLRPDWYNGVIFRDPPRGINSFGGGTATPYGGAVFPIYLHQRFGPAALTAVRKTFEAQKVSGISLGTIVNALSSELETPFAELLAEFWLWSYFTDYRVRPTQQFFDEAAAYGPAPLDPVQYKKLAEASTVRAMSVRGVVQDTAYASDLGAVLLRIDPDGSAGSLTIHVWGLGDNPHDWDFRVAIADTASVATMHPPQPVTVGEGPQPPPSFREVQIATEDWTRATDIVLVAANGAPGGSGVGFVYRIVYNHPAAVTEATPAPAALSLLPNFPNPFNPSTTIPIALDVPDRVSLAVYDASGRRVRTLLQHVSMRRGVHHLVWDGTSDQGRAVASGVYVAQLSTASSRDVLRMTLVR